MKRIVICADGTWNERDQVDDKSKKRHPTNVTKVARAVMARTASGVEQVVYYHNGVGTSGGLDKFTGGGFGEGIENNIRELYRFILYNYLDGDELYFFGFSRGAFTVRTLAGFMNKIGLVHKNDDYWIPEAYACYEGNKGPGTAEWDELFTKIKAQPCPPITFIGVWDTVGALGAPGVIGHVLNADKYKYHDVELHDSIKNAYHALAVDERREPFLPSIWTRPSGWTGTLEQAWFAGVHSNIGGGCTPDGLANEALHWMVEKAEKVGLVFDDAFLHHYTPCFNSVLQDSMSFEYRLFGNGSRTIGVHLSDGERVHQSAVDRFQLKVLMYHPENLVSLLGPPTQIPITDTTRIARGTPCTSPPHATSGS